MNPSLFWSISVKAYTKGRRELKEIVTNKIFLSGAAVVSEDEVKGNFHRK